MNRLFLFLLLLVLGSFKPSWAVTIPFTSYSPKLKVEPGIWQMRSASQLQKLLARNINNPRACYYIINQAYRVNLEVETVVALKPFFQKRPSDPVMQATYAYASLVGTLRAFSAPQSAALNKAKQYNLFYEQSSSYSFMKLTMSRTPEILLKSPEAIVMAAACYEDELYGRSVADQKRWDQLVSWSQRAIRLAPQWADAHYRYGTVLKSYAGTGDLKLPDATKQRLLLQAQTALLSAQRLDNSLPMQGSCARALASAFYRQKQYGQALRYIDIWFRYLPEYSNVPALKDWRQEIVRQLGKI